MSRDHFLLILWCLNFPKNTEHTTDWLHKVRPVADHFNNKMYQIYSPTRELSLDKGMLLWRGRLLIHQYVKGKCHKYGIRFYTLSKPHSLTLKFIIYSGKNDELCGKDHTKKVVLHVFKGDSNAAMLSIWTTPIVVLISLPVYLIIQIAQVLNGMTNNVSTWQVLNLSNNSPVCQQYHDPGKWKVSKLTYNSSNHEQIVTFVNRFYLETHNPLPPVKYKAFMKWMDQGDQILSYYLREGKNSSGTRCSFTYSWYCS